MTNIELFYALVAGGMFLIFLGWLFWTMANYWVNGRWFS